MKTIRFGRGCLEQIVEIPAFKRSKKILVVAGKKSYSQSGAENIMAPLWVNKDVFFFTDWVENPRLKDIEKGMSKIKDFVPDLIFAVGGGSAIDVAKTMNGLASCEGDAADFIKGIKKLNNRGLPLIAVPTTAGSGSEATHFSVIYLDGVKYSLAHDFILPDYAFIDPRLTENLSPNLTAVCGFDALSQAVESFWSVSSTIKSKKYASRAIKLLLSSLQNATLIPLTLFRTRMALGSHLAGKAINLTKTTATHALSYSMTTHFKIPHGHAVALLLGKFFSINSDCRNGALNEKRGEPYLKFTMKRLYQLFGCKTAFECEEKWFNLMKTSGLQTSFASFGIKGNAEFDFILDNANYERLGNNPLNVSKENLKKLIFNST